MTKDAETRKPNVQSDLEIEADRRRRTKFAGPKTRAQISDESLSIQIPAIILFFILNDENKKVNPKRRRLEISNGSRSG